MELKFKKQIPFIKWQYFFITLSLVIMMASATVIYVKGFNYGIDFRGGVKLTVKFNAPTSDGVIQDALDEKDVAAEVQRMGIPSENLFTIKTSRTEAALEDTVSKVTAALTEKFTAEGYSVQGEETVGPKAGEELKKKGQMAVLFSLLAMLIYISIRFDFTFAPGAIFSLVHDVVFTLGVIALMGIEFNLTILAVILTIVGYSVNDTIVIFDRIRENGKRISSSSIDSVVNECINTTLSRTIVTSLTVLIVVVILFFFGGGVIHDFAFTFIVGLISGTYSTIFIASPIYIFMYRRWPKVAVKLGLRKES